MTAVTRSRWLSVAPLGIALAFIGCACATPPTPSQQSSTDSPRPSELLPNGREIAESILVGGQPTTEQLAIARKLGYRTVINLRTAGEPGSVGRQAIESLGFRYVTIPISGADGVTEENARLLAEALAAAEHPVIVYCTSGNRVGAIFAMKAYHVDGDSAETALSVGKAAGLTRLEPVVRQRLELADQGASTD